MERMERMEKFMELNILFFLLFPGGFFCVVVVRVAFSA